MSSKGNRHQSPLFEMVEEGRESLKAKVCSTASQGFVLGRSGVVLWHTLVGELMITEQERKETRKTKGQEVERSPSKKWQHCILR